MSHSFSSNQINTHEYHCLLNNSQNSLNQNAANDFSSHSTELNYLPLPKPKLQIVEPQQSLNVIEEDLHVYHEHFPIDNLTNIIRSKTKSNIDRYKTSYDRLHECVRQSMRNIHSIKQEMLQKKYSIEYENELIIVLMHNHKVAKHEKAILYNIITNIWKQFDQRLRNELSVQYELEQLRVQHKNLLDMKIQQEKYRSLDDKLNHINNDIIILTKEIQQLKGNKYQLKMEIDEAKTHYSNNIIQLEFLKHDLIRSYTKQLNDLQLERDSVITQTELIKYHLFEQIQLFHRIVNTYRTSLTSFRSTITEIEQEIKEETATDLGECEINNLIDKAIINDDVRALVSMLEKKIDEKKCLNDELDMEICECAEKISKEREALIQNQNHLKAIESSGQEVKENLIAFREKCGQLKKERKRLEKLISLKAKQATNDHLTQYELNKKYGVLIQNKNLEAVHVKTLHEKVDSLRMENNHLKIVVQQCHYENTQLNPNNLYELLGKVDRLEKIRRMFNEKELENESLKRQYEKSNEKFRIKIVEILNHIRNLFKRMHENSMILKRNDQYIEILEHHLNEQKNSHVQINYSMLQIKSQLDSYRTEKHLTQMQIQVSIKHIQHSENRLKVLKEQLTICENDLAEQRIFLKKLNEFHFVLNEQDEKHLKELSRNNNRIIQVRNQYGVIQKQLKQMHDDYIKYRNVRSIVGRMIIRRTDLCQLLYKRLAHFDKKIYEQDQNIELVEKYIYSHRNQILQIRKRIKSSLFKKNVHELKCIRTHLDKIIDDSYENQQQLMKEVFRRRFNPKISIEHVSPNEKFKIEAKYQLLKTRLTKMIYRGTICNLVLLTIEQEFFDVLRDYSSKPKRENHVYLNILRQNLYQLMLRLKARASENNMFNDCRYYCQLISTDLIEQITKWKSKTISIVSIN